MGINYMSNYMIIDLETGIQEHIGRKGCYLVNKIVALVMKEANKSPIATLDYTSLYWRLASDPGIEILVGHNIKFDLLHLWKDGAIQLWLKGGGKIWDTQLVEYMLSGQRHKYPALRDIAVNKYRCPEREKKMEKYWNNNGNWFYEGRILPGLEKEFQEWLSKNPHTTNHAPRSYYGQSRSIRWIDTPIDTKDIPTELVLDDVNYDGMDTEAVMLKQVAEAKRIGMYNLIMLEMEGLLATTEMEYNGVYVNQEILERNKIELEEEIALINVQLKNLAPNVDNFKSTQQISRLFFGGTEKIKIDEPILNELGLPVVTKTGINRGKVKTRKVDKLVTSEGLGLKPFKEWEQKKEGIYRTDEGVLQIIAQRLDTIPGKIATLMLRSRGLNKLLSTYYVGTEKFIHLDDSCVHQQLCHCGYENKGEVGGGTGTGRLSCKAPNMQNQA